MHQLFIYLFIFFLNIENQSAAGNVIQLKKKSQIRTYISNWLIAFLILFDGLLTWLPESISIQNVNHEDITIRIVGT